MSKILNIAFIIIISVPMFAYANWAEEWYDANSAADPSVYMSQERGFATMGSFSGRLKVKNDHLMTISPPKLSVGCGGIDLFMGGFSFLNPQYLVEKGERILRAAPYVAFNMGLNALCSSCASAIDKAENIINALNSMQIDECKAAKGLVVSANHLLHGEADQAVEALQKNMVSGLDTLFTEAKKDVEDKPGKAFKKAVDNSNMSSQLKDELKKSGNILKRIAEKSGISSSQAKQIRALIGDVKVTLTDNELHAAYFPGCDQATYKNLINGTPFSKNESSSACAQTSGKSLSELVSDMLISISDKIATGRENSLTPAEKNFISMTPFPVKRILNTASKHGANQVTAVRNSMLQPTLHGYAFAIFMNILVNTKGAIEEYKALIDSGDGSLTKQLSSAIEKLLKKTAEKGSEARENYVATMKDTQAIMDTLRLYEDKSIFIQKVIGEAIYENEEK